MLKNILMALCGLLSGIGVASLQARTLTAEGLGSDATAARAAALETLASSIFVQIESNSELYQSMAGDVSFNAATFTHTDLPLIGVDVSCRPASAGQSCRAAMEAESAIPLYRDKLGQLAKSIDQRSAGIASTPRERRHDLLSSLLSDYDSYLQYRTVLMYLGQGKNPVAVPAVSRASLSDQMVALEAKAPSLVLAATLLTRNLDAGRVFIRPATLRESREITPFAAALLDAIRTRMPSTATPEQATHLFAGGYQQHAGGITVTYSLRDHAGNVLKTRVVELDPAAYQHLDTRPKAPDFDQLLHHGYAVSSDFQVSISTNKGQRQLIFTEGEEIEILIKVNQPGYFYLTGHAKNGNSELSYLLDMVEAEGDRRFVYYVNADQVNKWVSLGSFAVSAPFGTESLQVIASRDDLVNRLPSYQYDPGSDYYVISRNISQGVMKTRGTRGLKKVKGSEQQRLQMVESVLMFTTSDNR